MKWESNSNEVAPDMGFQARKNHSSSQEPVTRRTDQLSASSNRISLNLFSGE